MKKVKGFQIWDKYSTAIIQLIEDDFIVGSVRINIFNNERKISIEGLHVDFNHRKKGIGKQLFLEALTYVFSTYNDFELYLLVRKDNFIKKMYEEYGFIFYHIDEDDNYIWMKYEKI